ncbi:Nucleoside diphosphate-linked moiety X motif 19 [Halotydeus destructor]|nr:Nucleoside diphosphate-linked moiety X motif 19 [Halotydeus destructor]
MQSAVKWREASTLILLTSSKVAKSVAAITPAVSVDKNLVDNQNNADYNILMTKRSGKSSFYPSSYVFPGGRAEFADYSPKWWTLFDKLGVRRHPWLLTLSPLREPKPADYLNADIALRLTAIRETFEETGVLITTKSKQTKHDLKPTVDHKQWRKDIRDDPSVFLEFCQQHMSCPDVWSLFEWVNWLTPVSMKPRYDTMFYLACLDHEPEVVIDEKEVTVATWSTPSSILSEYENGQVELPPVQVYELSRLVKRDNLQQLKQFAETRQTLGIERWLPIIHRCSDGLLTILPGDDLHPARPLEVEADVSHVESIADMRKQADKLNRVEYLNTGKRLTQCNQNLPNGHIGP